MLGVDHQHEKRSTAKSGPSEGGSWQPAKNLDLKPQNEGCLYLHSPTVELLFPVPVQFSKHRPNLVTHGN